MPTEGSLKVFASRRNNLASQKYKCVECNLIFRDNDKYKLHMNTMKHKPEKYVKYHCEHCNYTTRLKVNFRKHQQTKKCKKNQPTPQTNPV